MDHPPRGQRRGRLLTARDVEELTRIDVKTIYMYVQKGLIPYVRIESNLRFPEDELLLWIDDHTYRTHPKTTRHAGPKSVAAD